MSYLCKAIQIAKKAHYNQYDKGGEPYILHPLAVMAYCAEDGEAYMATAVLHDVLEDSKNMLSVNTLIADSMPTDVWYAVKLLTKDDNEVYSDYIDRLCSSPLSIRHMILMVKWTDIEHNLDNRRPYKLNPSMVKRYTDAQSKISKALKELKNKKEIQ